MEVTDRKAAQKAKDFAGSLDGTAGGLMKYLSYNMDKDMKQNGKQMNNKAVCEIYDRVGFCKYPQVHMFRSVFG